MDTDKLRDPNAKCWDILSLTAISVCLLALLIQWRYLPFFLDMYYHLAVAKGFEAAGGVVGHNFWEYGPNGAAHLYPPLLHLIIVGLLKTGIDGVTMLKILSVIMPGLFLFTLWISVRRFLPKRTAFFVVYLSLCSSLFIVSASFTPAATLGMILLLIAIYKILNNRIIPASLALGLIFYTHIGIAAISIFFILTAAAFGLLESKKTLKILSISLLAGFPWLLHIMMNLSDISFANSAKMPMRLYPVIIILAAIGLAIATMNIKKFKLPVIFFISLTPMAILYPFRFLCAQGMIGFLTFAGIAMDKAYCGIEGLLYKSTAGKKYTLFLLVVALLYLIFLSPSIHISERGSYFKISDSVLTSIFEGKDNDERYVLSRGLFNRQLFNRLAEAVEGYTEKGEFLWSNNRYVSAVLWAMTARPSLSNTLVEVRKKNYSVNILDAALLIVIDEPRQEFYNIYKDAKPYFDTVKIEKEKETGIYIMANRKSGGLPKQNIPPPLISTFSAFIILALYLSSIIVFKA